MTILSNEYSRLTVKQVVDGKEITLLEVTDASDTPVTANKDILVYLTPSTD